MEQAITHIGSAGCNGCTALPPMAGDRTEKENTGRTTRQKSKERKSEMKQQRPSQNGPRLFAPGEPPRDA
jgi:hypothetical protein